MYSNDQAFLERLIERLRQLETLNHEHYQAILEVAREALLDAIAEVSLRIDERRRIRERGGDPSTAGSGDAPRDRPEQ